MLKHSLFALLICTLLPALGCGGGGGDSSSDPPPSDVAVSISPTSKPLTPGGSWVFSATVTGTDITGVYWTCTGGTISTSGSFTAPTTAGTYYVTATSAADMTQSATATVYVGSGSTVAVAVSPDVASVGPGETVKFTAAVTGTASTGVTWYCSGGGSITADGTFTAPTTHATCAVTAVSTADTSRSASATVNVVAGGVNVIIMPGTGSATVVIK